MTVFTSVHK